MRLISGRILDECGSAAGDGLDLWGIEVDGGPEAADAGEQALKELLERRFDPFIPIIF